MSFQPSKTSDEQEWHKLSIDALMESFKVSPSGLDHEEAKKRIHSCGLNRLKTPGGSSWSGIFFKQFFNPLVSILLFVSVFKFFINKPLDSFVLFLTIFLIVLIGFFQETRAENAMQSLKNLYSHKSKVKRENRVEVIESLELVPGDLILLESGDRIPADARIIECTHFKVNEASLTGESETVEKNTGYIIGETPLAERKNMVYTGTTVATGKATAVCVATGMNTELGKIALAIHEIKPEKTPLQKSINSLSISISVFVFFIILVFIAVSLYKGYPWMEIILFATSAAIAAIPEGLPAAVTIVLAAGMNVMAKGNALVRRLSAVETLGSTTLIASDKTGTLTRNEMSVKTTYVFKNNPERKRLLFEIGILANDAYITKKGDKFELVGDSTEGALLIAAEKEGIDHKIVMQSSTRLEEMPFESEKKYMATLCATPRGKVVYVKGSLEKLLEFSNLCDSHKQEIEMEMEKLSAEGLRILAAGYLPVSNNEKLTEKIFQKGIEFIGLFALFDPPREDAAKAILSCQQAGIRVVMITGDNKLTAQTIAKEIGIDVAKGVLTSQDIDSMSDEILREKMKEINVYARIEPLHKLKIVRIFKSLGEVVAMTGDGVNDAPALEAADIGIAMGITGTDVAKEAADMILIDDNFSSIEAAVEEGRAIFNRLRFVTTFLLTTCIGELLGLILSVGFTNHVYLQPLQILWINLITGVIVAIPLAMEPKTKDELKQPPRSPDVKLLYLGMVFRILFLAIMLGLSTFVMYYNALLFYDLKTTRTMVFLAIVVFEWLIAFNVRADEKTIFQIGLFSNKSLLVSIFVGLVLQIFILYTPFLQKIFQTTPLTLQQWLLTLLPGVLLFSVETVRKIVFPKMFNYGKWQRSALFPNSS
ncbi:MAG: HAD-IC family P-type ATPase [Chlamydiae bacterium]|nr:HAD-IC family P-type ATPase [Chlamydiota bacterium]